MIVTKKWKETLNTSYSGKFNLHFKVYCCFVFNFLNSFIPFQVFLSLICIGTAAGKENSSGRDEGKQLVARWSATSQSTFIAKARVLWKGRDQQFLQDMSWSHFYIVNTATWNHYFCNVIWNVVIFVSSASMLLVHPCASSTRNFFLLEQLPSEKNTFYVEYSGGAATASWL